MRVRFAPSPTGHLHVGNARTALFNWLLARRHGGTFVLRIEDTDIERSTRESEQAILDDLTWLGLRWDEGPDVGGPTGPYRQSERLPIYRAHADRLLDEGAAYICFCAQEALERDRQEAIAGGRTPKYAGTCRGLDVGVARRRVAAGEPGAVRFRVPDVGAVSFDDAIRGSISFDADTIGDPVIVRSDGQPAYNFAVVIDDSLMRITHVVRGEDHISNTPRQVLLYRALGLPPPRFAHLSLVMGPDHTPLSKRHGASSVAEFRARGYLPEALVNYLALIGWSPGADEELLPIEELSRRFSLDHVGRSAGVFDVEKLGWVNRHYLREASPSRLASLVVPHLAACGFVGSPDALGLAYLESLMPMVNGSVDRLDQGPGRLGFLFEFDPDAALAQPEILASLAQDAARRVLEALADELAATGRLADRDAFRQVVSRVRERTAQKGRALFHPIRIALTALEVGPELDLAVPAIDRGAALPPEAGVRPIVGCHERAVRFLEALAACRREA